MVLELDISNVAKNMSQQYFRLEFNYLKQKKRHQVAPLYVILKMSGMRFLKSLISLVANLLKLLNLCVFFYKELIRLNTISFALNNSTKGCRYYPG
jgi:hypothetical protein